MNSQDFIYWLNGFMEIANPKSLDENQIKVIRDHIALVLTKVTPNVYIPKLSSPTLDPNYFPIFQAKHFQLRLTLYKTYRFIPHHQIIVHLL